MSGVIGVFDSGLGGLSVLREIRALLPTRELLYVADSAHCPYGALAADTICRRSLAIGRHLHAAGACALVVACNTATGAAIEMLRRQLPLPVVGMEPGVKPAAAATRSGVIGVLATGPTLAAGRFAELVSRFAGGVEVLTQPCPGLVEQVEAGDLDGPETLELLRRYTAPMLARGADVIVLGCTHYPFLKPALARLLGREITLVDTGPAVARQLARVLADLPAGAADAAGAAAAPVLRLLTTGDPDRVAPVAARFWGEPVVVAPVCI